MRARWNSPNTDSRSAWTLYVTSVYTFIYEINRLQNSLRLFQLMGCHHVQITNKKFPSLKNKLYHIKKHTSSNIKKTRKTSVLNVLYILSQFGVQMRSLVRRLGSCLRSLYSLGMSSGQQFKGLIKRRVDFDCQ